MSNQAIYQFVVLAKSAKGKQAASVISQATSSSNCFVFSELINTPSILALKDLTETKKDFETLSLFCYGTYSDYKKNKENYVDLNEKQLYKLKQLSVVSLASSHRVLSYNLLLKALDIDNVRNLEDLLIDCFYADICKGKLDQKGKCVEIFETVGRDVRIEDIDSLIGTLKKWMDHSKDIQKNMEDNSTKAQKKFDEAKKSNSEYEKKVEELKKNMKEIIEAGGDGGSHKGKKNKF
eukprot:gene5875-9703_t